MMNPSMQWLSIIGGVIIFGYGLLRMDWVPMVLGALIVAFSVSKMMKTKAAGGQSKGKEGP